MVPFKYSVAQVASHFRMPDQKSPPEPSNAASAPQASEGRQSGSNASASTGSSKTRAMPPTPDPATQSPTLNPPANKPGDAPERLPNWLRQSERFLRVVVRMYLGLLICCAPWFPPAWDANPLFASTPWLLAIVTNGAVRGLVSGLGVLNLWIALRDALRNPERSQPSA